MTELPNGPTGADEATVERLVKDFLAEHPVETTPDRELRAARFDAGLAFVHFDKGFGGLGLDSSLSPLVEQLFLDAGCPDWMGRNVIGSFGLRGGPAHRGAGRVDITNGVRKYALYRTIQDGRDVWYVVDERSEVVPLSKELLCEIVMDLMS